MDPEAGRLPAQVLGENEALQQFFNGQDVSGVLDSSVTVDTSMLEQYLSNDVDPISFILPESPPDSSSESWSPAQIPGNLRYMSSYWSNQPTTQEAFQPTNAPVASSSCRFKGRRPAPSNPSELTHDQLCTLGLTNTYIKSGTPPAPPAPTGPPGPPAPLQQQHTHPHYLSPENYSQSYTPPTPPSPHLPTSNSYTTACTGPGLPPNLTTPPSTHMLGSASTLQTCTIESKKRRRSESEEPSAGVATSCSEGKEPHGGVESTASAGGVGLGSYQLLSWEQYGPEQWSTLHDSNYQTLSPPAYHVDTDKGFNYSTADESFVCQKKNHFQVTVHIGVDAEPQYIKMASGPQEINFFQIKVFGVKLETPSHLVTIEQSQPDRSKKPFHPVRVSLPGGKITRVTLGRLHFSETTANNMRKKGKPNPDQRYFQMVVGLYAVVKDESFLLTALVSEKIIVRASNPGQFETDGDTMWQRGAVQEALVCQGRVGINTDSPDEALVVCGNAKVMGSIMQPSDCRTKENIKQVDSEQQLKRINQMKIVEFDYKPEFASKMGIDHTHQTGIIAQEVKELLPSAVKDVGDVICSDGEKINNFLMVDKEQIFMENVGAVQQLSKLTDNLETRINELEVWNRRLAKLKSLTGSLRSTGRPQKHSSMSTISIPDACKTEKVQREDRGHKYRRCLRHKVFQISVFTLLATMAFCVISITALYLVNLKEEDFGTTPGNRLNGRKILGLNATPNSQLIFFNKFIIPGVFTRISRNRETSLGFADPDYSIRVSGRGESNSTVTPLQTSSWTSTVLPTGTPGAWPPAVDFCDLLYCDKVYCCPSSTEGTTNSNITISKATEMPVMKGKNREDFYGQLKNAGDWTNTTIHTIMIKESQLVIDRKYCLRDECGPGRYIFRVPVSEFVPINMKVTLLMNSTEQLVVHLCRFDESTVCSAQLDISTVFDSRYPSNTQGEHEWPLHVARLFQSWYHFRSTVAGQADCSTTYHYAGVLFTDYHFYFYRQCTEL